jgi:16S rRNA U516 pseudouridylate synthase RsuA-like enzyme
VVDIITTATTTTTTDVGTFGNGNCNTCTTTANNNTNTNHNKKVKLLHYLQIYGYANSNKKAKKLIRDQKVIVNGSLASSCSIMVMMMKKKNNNHNGTKSTYMCSEDDQVVILKDDDDHVNNESSSTSTSDNNDNNNNNNILNGKGSNSGKSSLSSSSPSTKPFCIVYNKPCGMICTTSKNEIPNNNPTCQTSTLTLSNVNIPNGYHPVGRLDKHSHGLLLFSLDGRFTSALLSPRTCISRVYEIIVCGDVGVSKEDEDDVNNGDDDARTLSRKYKDIMTKVENGVHTDYGFFQGKILDMKRDVGKKKSQDDSDGDRCTSIEYSYVHEKCNDDSYSSAKRNDKYGMSPEEFAKLDYVDDRQNSNTMCATSNRDRNNNILSFIRVRVNEGKKRMVRRLFAALDLFVLGKYVYCSVLMNIFSWYENTYTYYSNSVAYVLRLLYI